MESEKKYNESEISTIGDVMFPSLRIKLGFIKQFVKTINLFGKDFDVPFKKSFLETAKTVENRVCSYPN